VARVNVGISPKYISDQHLIAESVEITMITGGFRKNNYIIKSSIPETFSLGKGHINFFKNKIFYLKERLKEVNKELDKRGIKNSTVINISEYPYQYCNVWTPTMDASNILRNRIAHRLKTPLKAKNNFHRYYKQPIENMEEFINKMNSSELYHV